VEVFRLIRMFSSMCHGIKVALSTPPPPNCHAFWFRCDLGRTTLKTLQFFPQCNCKYQCLWLPNPCLVVHFTPVGVLRTAAKHATITRTLSAEGSASRFRGCEIFFHARTLALPFFSISNPAEFAGKCRRHRLR
jgi:hypothetical protein